MLPTLLLLCDKSVRSKKVQIKSVLVRISKLFNFMAKNDLETLKSHALLKDFQFLRWMGFKLKKSSEIILHQIQPLQSCMRKCVIRRLFLRTTSEAICPCVIRAAAVGEGLFPYFINANKWVDSIVQCFQLYSFDWQMWNLSLFWMAILCNVPHNTFAFWFQKLLVTEFFKLVTLNICSMLHLTHDLQGYRICRDILILFMYIINLHVLNRDQQ